MVNIRWIRHLLIIFMLTGCAMPEVQVSKPGAISAITSLAVSSSGAQAGIVQSTGVSEIQAAKQKVAADPTNWRCLNELGLAYSKSKLYDEAIAAFEQALALHPITTTIEAERKQQESINAQHTAALEQQKRIQDAQSAAAMNQLFSGLLGSIASMPGVDPNAVSLMPTISATMSASSQIDTSIPFIPRATVESQLTPKRELSSIYFNLGVAQFQKGIYSESILSLENSFSLDPSRSEILWWESEACFRQASYQKAIALMNRYLAIGADTPAPSVFTRLSESFRALGLDREADKAFNAAVDEYKRRIAADRDGIDATRELARAYMSQDRYAEAEKSLLDVLAKNESDDVRLELAACQLCQLHLNDAMQSVQKVLSGRGAESLYAWYIAGRIYDEQGLAGEALKTYSKAMGLMNRVPPGSQVSSSYGAIIKAAVGHYEEARKDVEANLSADPYGVNAYSDLYRLGLVYEKGGQDLSAIEAFNQALALRPKYGLARNALTRLEKKNAAKCEKSLVDAESAFKGGDYAAAMQGFSAAYQFMASGPRKQQVLQRILNVTGQVDAPMPFTSEAQKYYLRGNAALKSAKTPVDLDRAIYQFKWAAAHSPWAAPVYLNASVAYGVRLRYSEAIDSLKMFLMASPKAKNVEEALTKLAELEYQRENSLRSLSSQGYVR